MKQARLLVLRTTGSFVARADEECLRGAFDMRTFDVVLSPPRSLAWNMVKLACWLLWHLPRARGVFFRFADYHAFLPAVLCRLFRRRLWIVLAAFICGSLLTWLITSLTRPSSHLYLHSVSVPERAQTQTAAGPASTSPRLAVGPASSPGAAGSSAAGAAGQTGAAAPAAAQSDAATSPDSATTSAAAARAAGATPPGGGGASAAGAATQPSGSAGSTGGAAGSAAGAGAEGAGAASPAGAAAGGTSPETAGSDKGAAKEKAEEEEPSKKSRPKKKKRDRASSSRRSSPTMSYDRLMDLGAEQLRSDPRKAVATFMKALQTPSATSEARAKLGRAYLRLGDHGAAISQLERARRANPHYRPAMWDLAEAYRRVGDKDKARAIYKEMLRNVGPSSKSAARARKALDSL